MILGKKKYIEVEGKKWQKVAGVTWDKQRKNWRVMCSGVYIGRYKSHRSAVRQLKRAKSVMDFEKAKAVYSNTPLPTTVEMTDVARALSAIEENLAEHKKKIAEVQSMPDAAIDDELKKKIDEKDLEEPPNPGKQIDLFEQSQMINSYNTEKVDAICSETHHASKNFEVAARTIIFIFLACIIAIALYYRQ